MAELSIPGDPLFSGGQSNFHILSCWQLGKVGETADTCHTFLRWRNQGRKAGWPLRPLLPCACWKHHLKDSAVTQPAPARPVNNGSFIWVLTAVSPFPLFSVLGCAYFRGSKTPNPCHVTHQPLEGLTLSQSPSFSLWLAVALTPL